MLPPPPMRIRPPAVPRLRRWLARVNSYTLWAFNPQPPVAYPKSDRTEKLPQDR